MKSNINIEATFYAVIKDPSDTDLTNGSYSLKKAIAYAKVIEAEYIAVVKVDLYSREVIKMIKIGDIENE